MTRLTCPFSGKAGKVSNYGQATTTEAKLIAGLEEKTMRKYLFVVSLITIHLLIANGGAECEEQERRKMSEETPITVEVPTPYLYLSFDREFHMEGIGIETLKSFADSSFPGVAKAPAGEFVEGVSGKAFIPKEDLTIEGAAVLPQPEGTVSLWIKPVNYEEDWLGGKDTKNVGRIGFFLTASHSGEVAASYDYRLQVRGGDRWDPWAGLNYYEYWWYDGPRAMEFFWGEGNQVLGMQIWQDGRWRMVTIVWASGERRMYLNGLPVQIDADVPHTAHVPATHISIPAGSKTVDELTVWDIPLTDAQVAANFYSRMPESGLKGAIQNVPCLPVVPDIGKETGDDKWGKTVKGSSWVDSFSGMASDGRDTLELGHRDGYLFMRYKEPMPADYVGVKTLLGGHILRRSVVERDGNVWADDCVEVRLTGDGGETNYVFAVSASGALCDMRNGDEGYTAADSDWVVWQDEGEKFWTVEMRLSLAALSDKAVPDEWGFNFVRTVRQQGFAMRQWSFAAGDEHGYGRLILSDSEQMPIAAEMGWSETTGELSVAAQGIAESPLTVSYSAVPLNHVELFPEEKVINRLAQEREGDPYPPVKKLIIPPASREEQLLEAGDINWQSKLDLDYVSDTPAVASLLVKDATGTVLARRVALITSRSQIFSIQLIDLPSSQKLVTRVSLISDRLAGKDVIADIAVVKKGETKQPFLQEEIDGFQSRVEEASIDVSGIPVGDYVVEATVTKDGELLGKESKEWFRSGTPEWLGNDIGILKSVPEPWTPVEQKGSSIEVWGREHSFAGTLLPASMKVLGEEILAGPMRLIIKTGDETIDTAKVDNPRIVIDQTGIKASIIGKATGKSLIVELNGELEFDGFGYFTFTFKPINEGETVPVESIIFEVPFKKKYAEYFDDTINNVFETQSGLIPKDGIELGGTNTIRVGDTYRGVQFFPLFQPLGTRTSVKPIVFTPTADSMIMRYSISEGVAVDRPLTSSIGIMGTPVKPYDPKRIRKTRHSTGMVGVPDDLRKQGYSCAAYFINWWTNLKGVWGGTQPPGSIETGYYNYSPEWCADFAKSALNGYFTWNQDWENNGVYQLLKIQFPLITARSPEYALFWKEWGGQYYDYLDQYKLDLASYRGAPARPPGRWTEVSFAVRSYQDFFIYSLDKLLSACAAEGVPVGWYFDCNWYGPNNPYPDPRPYRQFLWRLYQVTRKHSPDSIILSHMSGDRRMAIWSMVDVLFEGEQFSAAWSGHMAHNPELSVDDCYPTLLPLDRVRASYAGTLWGPQPVFFTQFELDHPRWPRGPGKNPWDVMRYGVGLMLAHDTIFCGKAGGGEPFANKGEDPWIKRARWGYDETVKFIPYWDNKGMLEVESPDKKNIVASAWFRPDGNLMVIVFNNTDNPALVRLTVNEQKFPVKLRAFSSAEDITSPSQTSDATSPDVYEYKKGVLEVDIRPRDYRLLIFR